MKNKLKIALVGCGQIADGHISEIQKMNNAEVVAICDLEILMAQQASIRYKIPSYYDSYIQMLENEKPDVIHIATPPQSHLSLAKLALDAGCHVYIEKPLTPTYKESLELIEYVKNKDKKMTIGWNYYFDPPALRVRKMVNEGNIGRAIHAESFFGYGLAGAFGKAILGTNQHWVHTLPGKLFHNNIDHMLNKVVEYLDTDKPKIDVISDSYRSRRFGDIRDEMPDELRVMIKGEKTSAYCTFSSHIKPTTQFLRLYGSEQTLYADFTGRTVVKENEPSFPSAIGRMLHAFSISKKYKKEGWGNLKKFIKSDYHFFVGLNTLIGNFYDSILHENEVPIPYDHMLRVSWMMEEIFNKIKAEQVGKK